MKQKLFSRSVYLLTALSILLALSYHIVFWPFELLLSFTTFLLPVFFAGLIASLVFFVITKSLTRKFGFVLVAGFIASYHSLAYTLTLQPQTAITADKGQTTIKFATFNKLYKNKDLQKTVDYFKKQNVDVLAVQEANEGEIKQLSEQLELRYFNESGTVQVGGGAHVGVLSRYPITESKSIELGSGPSLLRAAITTPKNGELAFYSLHLSGPFTLASYQRHNTDIKRVARVLKEERLPAVLGGDFNTTIFSPTLRDFNDTIDHEYQTVTTDPWPTCSWYGFGTPLCIRIDQVYIPKRAKLIYTFVAPNLGSDHRAIVTEFAL